uniref:Uncharacterized protein n=1 Tax=Klebsiella pneumoniae TaxID=573 RepID=A0A8B0SXK5_KLEPN|nr:hypothetical protein [Klebsiella pneumoniae]
MIFKEKYQAVKAQLKCPLSSSIKNDHFDLSFSLLIDFPPTETTG